MTKDECIEFTKNTLALAMVRTRTRAHVRCADGHKSRGCLDAAAAYSTLQSTLTGMEDIVKYMLTPCVEHSYHTPHTPPRAALPHVRGQQARDGSSGGVIRLAVINKEGVQRSVYKGAEVPQFYSK